MRGLGAWRNSSAKGCSGLAIAAKQKKYNSDAAVVVRPKLILILFILQHARIRKACPHGLFRKKIHKNIRHLESPFGSDKNKKITHPLKAFPQE
jgi:hypothetical protein